MGGRCGRLFPGKPALRALVSALSVLLALCAVVLAEDAPDMRADSRDLGLTGVGNARELGGYVGAGGRAVKRGVLLRTARLSDATDGDLRRLQEVYHLGVVLDLRMSSEAASAPDPAMDGVEYLNLRIIDEAAMDAYRARMREAAEAGEAVEDAVDQIRLAMEVGLISEHRYVDNLSAESGREGYRRMFQALLQLPEGASLLFHCTQGKDRTGLAAMLVLSALGADDETIMADYLLTNAYNAALIEEERQWLRAHGLEGDALEDYLSAMDAADPRLMETAMAWLRERYGSPEGYITQALGLSGNDIEALRDKFLEAPPRKPGH